MSVVGVGVVTVAVADVEGVVDVAVVVEAAVVSLKGTNLNDLFGGPTTKHPPPLFFPYIYFN